MKTLITISVMIVVIILFNHIWDYSLYSNKTYETGREHLDMKIKGFMFSADHFFIGDHGEVLLSEHLSGFHVQTIFGSHYLFPLKRVTMFSDKSLKGSLSSLGVVSVCLYRLGENKDNIVVFFDIDRGMININGHTVHLSSLFLGKDKEHVCPKNNIEMTFKEKEALSHAAREG
ncbi:PsaF/MyfF family fimbrial adhesin regulatory protein [Hafnia paralvei]|uniref:PsaF/MyfF family fimbrial adhesin regulatory protein n=1 Tax=Hafnia paralvei TaxID=546367 RepID=UPI001033EC55|nr:PsaF/MyfF family fimbrial adhesin regulatory protein [Hafnia paralvei]TBL61980.1 hypothetical protein EYY97_10240 [Hafnia paralvei]